MFTLAKKILVTGGLGFIGSHVVDELVKEGHEVLVYDDLSGCDGKNYNLSAKYFAKDVSRPNQTIEAIEKMAPDEVWHLAANAREGGSWFQPQNVVARNSFGVINVLEGAIRGGKLKKFVFFSSMSVYGHQKAPYTEDMDPKPDNPYAVSKHAAERYVQLLSDLYHYDWVIIRPHNVFGERTFRPDRIRNVVAIFINQVLRGEPINIYGDGSHMRAHSYIYDCIGPIMKAGKLKNEIINIGGERAFTIKETAEMVRSALQETGWGIKYHPGRYKEVPFAFCDHSKAVELLDFKEVIGAEEGIKRVAATFAAEGPVDYDDKEPLTIKSEKIPKTWN